MSLFEKIVSYSIGLISWTYFTIHLYRFSQGQLDKYQSINGLENSYFGFKRVNYDLFKDYSDNQWTHYRHSLPLIMLFFGAFVLFSYLIKTYSRNITHLKLYYFALGIGFAVYLHRIKIIFLIAILLLNYLITVKINNGRLLTLLMYV